MTIPEIEKEVLQILETKIQVSIPELPELERYRFGYYVEEDHISGLSLFSCAQFRQSPRPPQWPSLCARAY